MSVEVYEMSFKSIRRVELVSKLRFPISFSLPLPLPVFLSSFPLVSRSLSIPLILSITCACLEDLAMFPLKRLPFVSECKSTRKGYLR